jgi:hypothetical protein
MNETLKRLMLEAGYAAPEIATRAHVLAELIVKECAQHIEDKFDFYGDELLIAEKLKEHFGVKE